MGAGSLIPYLVELSVAATGKLLDANLTQMLQFRTMGLTRHMHWLDVFKGAILIWAFKKLVLGYNCHPLEYSGYLKPLLFYRLIRFQVIRCAFKYDFSVSHDV